MNPNELKYDYELAEKTKYINPLEIMSEKEYHKMGGKVLENDYKGKRINGEKV